MRIYYKNHYGQTVDLTALPYIVTEADLFDFDWKYENRSSLNPKISRFYKELTKKNLKIALSAKTKDEYKSAWTYLLEVTEKDVLAKVPGKLYVNDEYLSCYIFKSKKTDWYPGAKFLVNNITVISESGKWIREVKVSYTAGEQSSSDDSYMDYAYDYAYDYSSSSGLVAFDNPGYAPADFEMTIHGPCENPEVFIAGHSYSVTCELLAGEYLRIDSANRRVYKVRVNAEQVNQFNMRNRESYIFEKIPTGNCGIAWDGSFSIDIVLYEERSEPRWT